MIRRPPRSTRTDTLFPYTTLFRSVTIVIARVDMSLAVRIPAAVRWRSVVADELDHLVTARPSLFREIPALDPFVLRLDLPFLAATVPSETDRGRSAERCVGTVCVSTCSFRWSPLH